MASTPIADYAFLSDGRTSALVDRAGSVDWLCLPRFDSPAVLARLLDGEGGRFVLRPTDPAATAARRYLPRTLVLETVWRTPTGVVEVVDALATGPRERGHDLGLASPGVLLRQATCTEGTVDVEVVWQPRPEFGLVHPRLRAVAGGVLGHGGSTGVLLSCSADLDLDGATASTATGGVRLEHADRQRRRLTLAVQQVDPWAEPPPAWSARDVRRRLTDTRKAWESWSELHQRYQGPLAELVHTSGLVLRGLTYTPSGAIVAAATTSLPEGVGTGRTWDYRYAWVRDASMTLRGLWVAACPDEARSFFTFLAEAAGTQLQRGRHLQIMYGVGGERDLSERELAHLAGWRESAPVRVGNGAWQQQLDVYGALLDAALVLREQLGDLEEATRDLLVDAVEAAARDWTRPDQGIWEIRGPARHYLYSALMCWVALDRGITLAGELGVEERRERWTEVRAEIRAAIEEQGWDEGAGCFTQSLGSSELDASSLMVGLVGFLAPDDPRVVATIDAVAAGLVDDRGLVLRYRAEDGLDGAEGSFLLCTFWLAEALVAAGRRREGEQVLLTAAGFANDLGLLAEQVDGATGELLGNYPQAFSHLGLVLAAQALATTGP